MKFTIDRSKWRNSHHGIGANGLLNRDGYMCCLGFCAAQLGVPSQRLLNKETPGVIKVYVPSFDPEGILTVDTKDTGIFAQHNNTLSVAAIRINDSDLIPLLEKEEHLTKLFSEHNHEIVFTGEYNSECTLKSS